MEGQTLRKKKRCRAVCGPVRSRRLGTSLGVDLVPFKTCPYDCIYCELGRTTDKTTLREDYIPAGEIISDVLENLSVIPAPDHITLAGAGEPTLHRRIGEVIRGIKEKTDIPVALLTGGALFWMKEVRESVAEADLIIPSLDCGDEKLFRSINRPHEEITFEKMVSGLYALRKSYRGPIWLEIFLVDGLNTADQDILNIKRCAERIAPGRIQLNTVDRAPAEPFVNAPSLAEMERIASIFGPRCEVIRPV